MAESFGKASEMKGDAFATQFAAVQFGGVVVADAADIVRAQSPTLARDQSSGDLAAGHDLRVERFDLGAERGELRNLQDSVGGVFADAENIEFGGAHG